jgi:hypothetical protein
MASPCYYHPDTIASATCVQCGLPICANCTDRVGEKTVCQKCVKAVKTRLEAQMAAAPAGAYGSPAVTPGYGGPTPAYGGPSYGGRAVAMAPDRIAPGTLILGIVVAALISIVGAIIVEKILFLSGYGIAYLYIGIGYGIGFGLHKVVGRGGMGMALLAVGIMVFGLLIGQLVFTADELGKLQADDPTFATATTAQLFPYLLTHMSPMHWICVVIGLFACFRGMNSQQ